MTILQLQSIYLFIYLPHPTAEGPPVTGMGSININIKITISKNYLYINKAFKAIKKKKKERQRKIE